MNSTRKDATSTDTATSPEALRAQMLEKVQKAGYAQRSEVERVLRDTPRHEFLPEADLEVAYNPWQAVVTHRFQDGAAAENLVRPGQALFSQQALHPPS